MLKSRRAKIGNYIYNAGRLSSPKSHITWAGKQLAEKEGVTEHLKAENAMLWVQKMNNIQNRAREIVKDELIYS